MARFHATAALLLASALLAVAQLSHAAAAAAPSISSEEFWRTALPDTALPDAVRWYLQPDTSYQGTINAGDDASNNAVDEERLSHQWPYYFYTLKQQSASSKPVIDDKTATADKNVERLSRQWPYYFYSLKQKSASSKPVVDDKLAAADDTVEQLSRQWPYYFYSLKQGSKPSKPVTADDSVERLSRQWPYYFYSLKQKSASSKHIVDDKPAATDDNVEQMSRQWPYYFYSLKQKSASPKPVVDDKLAAADDTAELLSRQWPYYFYSLKQGSKPSKPATADDSIERLSRQWPYYFYSLKQRSASSKPVVDDNPATTDDTTTERLSRQWPYYFYSLKKGQSPSSHKHAEHSAAGAGSSGHSHMMASGHDKAKMNHSTMFFFEEMLQVGRNLSFYLPPARRAPLGMLPRNVADSIPFSTSSLPDVLAWLGIAPGSAQAADMEETLRNCEAPAPTVALEGRFCATSLEALVERAMAALGTRDIRPVMSALPRSGAPWQTYTIRAVRPVAAVAAGGAAAAAAAGSRFVACHDVVYPYTVYRCHDTGMARVYMVEMEGSRGGGVVTEAVICHLDTSQWVADHISFKLLGTKPGGPPICHTMPFGHIVWANNEDGSSAAT